MKNTLFFVEGKAEAQLVRWLVKPSPRKPRIREVNGNVSRLYAQIRYYFTLSSQEAYSLIICIFDTDLDPKGCIKKDLYEWARQKKFTLKVIANKCCLEAELLRCCFPKINKPSSSKKSKNVFKEKFGCDAAKMDWNAQKFLSREIIKKDCPQIKGIFQKIEP